MYLPSPGKHIINNKRNNASWNHGRGRWMDADCPGGKSTFSVAVAAKTVWPLLPFCCFWWVKQSIWPFYCVLHLSLDNNLCILNKDFILPTRRKLLTRCSWPYWCLTSFYCCMGGIQPLETHLNFSSKLASHRQGAPWGWFTSIQLLLGVLQKNRGFWKQWKTEAYNQSPACCSSLPSQWHHKR